MINNKYKNPTKNGIKPSFLLVALSKVRHIRAVFKHCLDVY
jgi:hypothetical protein